ncbi:hypothetical protein JCM10212_000868 [Sporobolomyces blumeae]
MDPYPDFATCSLSFSLDDLSLLHPYQLALVSFHPATNFYTNKRAHDLFLAKRTKRLERGWRTSELERYNVNNNNNNNNNNRVYTELEVLKRVEDATKPLLDDLRKLHAELWDERNKDKRLPPPSASTTTTTARATTGGALAPTVTAQKRALQLGTAAAGVLSSQNPRPPPPQPSFPAFPTSQPCAFQRPFGLPPRPGSLPQNPMLSTSSYPAPNGQVNPSYGIRMPPSQPAPLAVPPVGPRTENARRSRSPLPPQEVARPLPGPPPIAASPPPPPPPEPQSTSDPSGSSSNHAVDPSPPGPFFSMIEDASYQLAPAAMREKIVSVLLTNLPPCTNPLLVLFYLRRPGGGQNKTPRPVALSTTTSGNIMVGFAGHDQAERGRQILHGVQWPGIPNKSQYKTHARVFGAGAYTHQWKDLSDEVRTWRESPRGGSVELELEARQAARDGRGTVFEIGPGGREWIQPRDPLPKKRTTQGVVLSEEYDAERHRVADAVKLARTKAQSTGHGDGGGTDEAREQEEQRQRGAYRKSSPQDYEYYYPSRQSSESEDDDDGYDEEQEDAGAGGSWYGRLFKRARLI